VEPLTLRVSGRRQETHDTVTFFLEPAVPFAAGQFITLLIGAVRRSYSLSSSPGDQALSITVKRKPNGEISRWLQDKVRVGDTLTALAPSGRFTFQARTGAPRDIGFIAAGSGIAPVLSLIRQALAEEPFSQVWLIYQNHSEADIIFADTLRALPITLVELISPTRLNNALLEALVPTLTRFDPSDSTLFCCGPEAFMRMAHFTLRLMGFREDQYRQEHFVIEAPPQPPLLSDTDTHRVTLRTRDGDRHFSLAYPTNILQAALDNGVSLPYSCRGGRCSTCAVRCLSGKVVMSSNDVLTDQDLAEGWVLTCTGYAVTDLLLER
jgi:2Fe-2S type ferredoxin